MAIDIQKINNVNSIDNRGSVVGDGTINYYQDRFTISGVTNQSMVNTPTINQLESKFDSRWDDGSDIVINGLNDVIFIDDNKYARNNIGVQNALNDLSTNGGMIVLPEGVYVFTSGIHILKDNVIIRGVGASSKITTSGMTSTFITVGGASSANNFILQDFQIDGTNQTYLAVGGSGIEHNDAGCGILVDDRNAVGVSNGLIKNLLISNVANESIAAFGRDTPANARELWLTIQGNTIINYGYRGIHPHLDHTLRIIDNNIRDASGHIDGAIRHGHIIQNNRISNVHVTNPIASEASVIYCSDMESIVCDNHILNCSANEYAIYGWLGQDYGDQIKNNVIIGGSYAAAIELFSNDIAEGNRIISNNGGNISNGIATIDNSSGIRIINNHLTNINSIGIYCSADAQIMNNTIDGQGTSWSIWTAAGTTKIVVQNNTLSVGKIRFENNNTLAKDNFPLNNVRAQVYDGTRYVTQPYTISTPYPNIRWWMSYVLLNATGMINAILPDPTYWNDQRIRVTAINLDASGTVGPFSGEKINGSVQNIVFSGLYDTKTFLSDSTDWWTV